MSDSEVSGGAVERETIQVGGRQRAERNAATRKAFAAAVVADKAPPPEPPREPAEEPDEPAPAWLDPEVSRLRRELADERGKAKRSPVEYDDVIDRPGTAVRGWLESARGDAYADDSEWKADAADLVTRLASEVLGVALPSSTRAKLDAAAARKTIKHARTTAAKRETERAGAEEHERKWSSAAATLSQKLAPGAAAAKDYPLLSGEVAPGSLVIDIVRAADDAGEKISWTEAAKLAEAHLRRTRPKPAAAAKVERPLTAALADEPEAPRPPTPGKWTKEGHRQKTLAALRAGKVF